MTPITTVDGILELYAVRGDHHYGEDVSQTAHALQCAALARHDGAPDALVCAALLHDVGHLAGGDGAADHPGDLDDDHHDAIGARLIASVFGPRVAAPVALHVTAKRWRCAVEPAYLDQLTAASRASLLAQGGPLDEAARTRFEAHPSFADAVRLREWDDLAKDPSLAIGTIAEHRSMLERLAASWRN